MQNKPKSLKVANSKEENIVVDGKHGGDSAQWESMWPNVNLPKIEARSG